MSKAYYTQEEVSKIKQARLLEDRGVTHYAGCYDGGPKHYECALLEVKRLRSESEAHMNPSDKYEQIKDIKRLNPVELEATVVHHEQQIKDLAAHLLELQKYTDFKRSGWVGLTGVEVNHIFAANVGYSERMMQEVEAKLKAKNSG